MSYNEISHLLGNGFSVFFSCCCAGLCLMKAASSEADGLFQLPFAHMVCLCTHIVLFHFTELRAAFFESGF